MWGELLTAGSALAGALSKPKDKAMPTSGFGTLPPEVQEAWLQNYLPKALSATNLPYQGVPMERVSAPNDIFDSEGLWKLQQYSDSMGGLFSPMNGQARQQQQAAPQQSSSATLAQLLPYLSGNIKGYVGDKGRSRLGQDLMSGAFGSQSDVLAALKRALGGKASGSNDSKIYNFFGANANGGALKALLGG